MSWGYSYSNGPHTWAVNFPDAAGHDQSPIDIHTNETIFDSELETKPLSINYSAEDSFTACNTGSSFKVNISKTSELRGGPLTDAFKLEQFHLHWGSSDDHGSEHMIDGQTYAAELHLVHYNSTKYSSFGDAVNQPDGLAVLGIMIQSGAENVGFKDMVDTIRNVKKGGQTCQVLKSFNPTVLLPENTKEFWTYHGSLTTPPCYESVQWIVLRQPVQYSPNQVKFVTLKITHHYPIQRTKNCFQTMSWKWLQMCSMYTKFSSNLTADMNQTVTSSSDSGLSLNGHGNVNTQYITTEHENAAYG